MEVKACVFTDAGKVRSVNQDAAMIKVANTRRYGRISFAAICDGMGGLSRGEVASCKVIRALENWFLEEFSLMQGMHEDELWKTAETSLRRLIVKVSGEIKRYGRHRGIDLGTTMTALLQIGRKYMTLNIGDSRIYLIDTAGARVVTKDQSLVQDKMEKGLITPEQMDTDPERNVLLSCIGTTTDVDIQVGHGELEGSTTVLACSDGFWRTLKAEEIHKSLCPQMCVTDSDMLEECRKLTGLAFSRKEKDNISAAAMCLEF